MKKLLLLFLFVCVAVPGLMAQNDVTIKQVNVGQQKNAQGKYIGESISLAGDKKVSLAEFDYLDAFFNSSSVNKQTTAIISQIGNGNTSIINQTGESNYGAIYITGDNNWTKLSQVGNDFSILVVKGSNNRLEMRQTDPGVRSFIKLKNTYGVNMLAKQNSNGMTLTLFGGNAQPMTISGQNIPIIITTHN